MQNILDNFSKNKFGMRQVFLDLLRKYALLLCVYFAASLFANMLAPYLMTEFLDLGYSNTALYQAMFYVPTFLLNVAVIVIMNSDMQRIGIRHRTVLLLTLLYCSIGVMFFLAIVLYHSFFESAEASHHLQTPAESADSPTS